MAISIISISSDSSEEVMDTAASQTIMIGSIETPLPVTTLAIIPPTPTDTTPTPAEIPTTSPTTPLSPDSPVYSSDSESDPSEDIPPLSVVVPLLSSTV